MCCAAAALIPSRPMSAPRSATTTWRVPATIITECVSREPVDSIANDPIKGPRLTPEDFHQGRHNRPAGILQDACLDGGALVAKAAARDQLGKGGAGAAPGSIVGLSCLRAARSVADPHRRGIPRSCAADRADQW